MDETRIQTAKLDDSQAELAITWGDGHASRYPLRYLRGKCPCAACRTAREEARTNPFRVISGEEARGQGRIVNIEPIGRYGLRLVWDDGHSTGIYTLEYLREICPCEACTAERPQEEKPWAHGIYIG
ncbi:MAG: gamma-butyrobetaine hydroxylase-like domain-containing protein [Armatimonadota bacterium]